MPSGEADRSSFSSDLTAVAPLVALPLLPLLDEDTVVDLEFEGSNGPDVANALPAAELSPFLTQPRPPVDDGESSRPPLAPEPNLLWPLKQSNAFAFSSKKSTICLEGLINDPSQGHLFPSFPSITSWPLYHGVKGFFASTFNCLIDFSELEQKTSSFVAMLVSRSFRLAADQMSPFLSLMTR